MKGIINICFMMIVASTTFAQYNGQGPTISRFRPGAMWFLDGLTPAKDDRRRKYDRLIFDLTYNDWIGDRELFQNHWASIGLNTNFMFDIPLTKGNKVALGIGISHELRTIRHNGNLVRVASDESTEWQDKLSGQTFNKGIWGGNSFSVPLELRFRNESWRHFKLHLGGKVGYQVNMFSKYVTGSGNTKLVEKQHGFLDPSDLIYSAHVRIGFRNWALFGSYNFNTLFTNSNSVQLNLVQGGLSISLF